MEEGINVTEGESRLGGETAITGKMSVGNDKQKNLKIGVLVNKS